MKNYIVWIDRRDGSDRQQIAGIVENVEKRENTTFKSFEELMKLMGKLPKFRVKYRRNQEA
jgi:hypothetical protein